MVDKDLLATKLAELADRCARVRERVPSSVEQLRNDRDALELVAFNLMLAVQLCSDIASHFIADEGWAAARSLAEGFARLEEHGVLSASVAAALKQAAGLRNVVALGNAGSEVELCFRAATAGLRDLEAFAREVSAWR